MGRHHAPPTPEEVEDRRVLRTVSRMGAALAAICLIALVIVPDINARMGLAVALAITAGNWLWVQKRVRGQ